MNGLPDANFWRNKRVLVTGHTGFKGAWLTIWLKHLGAQVTGISIQPPSNPNLFTLANVDSICNSIHCDIRNFYKLAVIINDCNPEIVLHLAAQSLVRKSYEIPLATFETNVIGTANVLESIKALILTRVGIMITTDKVYANNEWPWPYREDDKLGGHDPYSASKAACELVIDSYHKSSLRDQNVAIASTRAGNVIGGGDWARERLIPDAIRSWQTNKVLHIRRPNAIRPWQHVLEPLNGYLILAQKLWTNPELAGAFNFGPPTHEAASVRDVIEMARSNRDDYQVQYGDGTEGPHEAGWLALEIAKSRQLLGFKPRLSLNAAVSKTMAWYLSQHQGADAYQLCLQDIIDYEATA
ncbi:CDP-glucose 4,6-dehydratase [Achromatium sp. WMS2]|nr:CDP-glucose 4,6-dehydratase [Achromatium sp. WMS2]